MVSLRQLLSQLDDDQLRALGQNRGQALGQNPQILTPTNREAITRPRTVVPQDVEGKAPVQIAPPVQGAEGKAPASFRDMLTQQPTAPVQPEVTPNAPFGSSGEPFGVGNATRPRPPQIRDYIADDSQYLRDLEQQPRNWKDKTVDAIRGLNQHFNPGSGQGAPTKRERDIARAQNTLGRDIAVTKERSMADTREAAILAGQERIRQGDERLQQGGDRIKQQQRQTLASVLNRMDEFDPEAPENLEMVNALRANNMPVVNKKRGQQLKFVQDASTGEWKVIAGDKTTGAAAATDVATPEGETLATDSEQKLGREQNASQFEKRLRFQREMGALNREAAMARAQVMANAGNLRLGDADEYGAMADKLDDEAEGAELDGTRTGKETAARLRTMANQNRVLASKARKAQSGSQPATTTKSGSEYAGRRISKSKIPEFAKRHKMTEAEATKFLTDSKAVIY